jgi:hypothetical protein
MPCSTRKDPELSELVFGTSKIELLLPGSRRSMEWLARYDAKYFYSLNYIAQPLSVLGESRNLWAPRPGPLYEKSPTKQKFSEWSFYRGRILSKTTYAEGLDLLRHDMTPDNAKAFVDIVLEKMPYHPKELLYIVKWLVRKGEMQYEPVEAQLSKELGGMLLHSPLPPVRS